MTQKPYVKNIKTLIERAETEVYRDVKESNRLLEIALKLAQDSNDDTMCLEVQLAIVLTAYASDVNADIYKDLLAIVDKGKKDNNTYILSKAYLTLGQISMHWNLYEKASQFFEKSLIYAEEDNDLLQIFELYNARGVLAMHYKQFDKARQLFKRGLEIAESANNQSRLPLIHANLGRVYFYEEKLEASLKELEIAKQLLNSKHSKEVWGNVYYLSGQYKRRIGEYDTAIDHLELGISYFNSINRVCASAPLYKEISDMYLNTHDISRALYNYIKALEVAELGELSKECLLFTGMLAEIYEQLGMDKEAFNHYKSFRKMSHSIEDRSLFHKIKLSEFK